MLLGNLDSSLSLSLFSFERNFTFRLAEVSSSFLLIWRRIGGSSSGRSSGVIREELNCYVGLLVVVAASEIQAMMDWSCVLHVCEYTSKL